MGPNPGGEGFVCGRKGGASYGLRCSMVSCPGKCIPIKKFCKKAKTEIKEATEMVKQYYRKYQNANKKLVKKKLSAKSPKRLKKLKKKVNRLKDELNKYADIY